MNQIRINPDHVEYFHISPPPPIPLDMGDLHREKDERFVYVRLTSRDYKQQAEYRYYEKPVQEFLAEMLNGRAEQFVPVRTQFRTPDKPITRIVWVNRRAVVGIDSVMHHREQCLVNFGGSNYLEVDEDPTAVWNKLKY